jgi:hypothetical protein
MARQTRTATSTTPAVTRAMRRHSDRHGSGRAARAHASLDVTRKLTATPASRTAARRTAGRTGAGHQTVSPRRDSHPENGPALPPVPAPRAGTGCRLPGASTCRTAAGSRRELTGRSAHLASHRMLIRHRSRGRPGRAGLRRAPRRAPLPGGHLRARRQALVPRRAAVSPGAASRVTTVPLARPSGPAPRHGRKPGRKPGHRPEASSRAAGGPRQVRPSGSVMPPSLNVARSVPPSPSRPSRRTGLTRSPVTCGRCAPRPSSTTQRWPRPRTTR